MNRVRVQCMGTFRELGDSFEVFVEQTTVGAVREAVEKYFISLGQSSLVAILNRSAFASDDELLRDYDSFESESLTLLPPVAGG